MSATPALSWLTRSNLCADVRQSIAEDLWPSYSPVWRALDNARVRDGLNRAVVDSIARELTQ